MPDDDDVHMAVFPIELEPEAILRHLGELYGEIAELHRAMSVMWAVLAALSLALALLSLGYIIG